ncbi:MAG: homoaconitate hydratase [Methanomassiliicoccales archaeon]|nr:MAG: homoaconitate hydratase [Methanomassiliicoccales archaeon]
MFEQEIAVSPYNFLKGVVDFSLMPKDITVYDSTLRDGEQMPGVSFNENEKLTIARKLDAIGVPQIEAGFPAVSSQEKKTVAAVKKEGLDAEILALSRLKKEDVDVCIDCDIDMVLLFIASSSLHLKYKLRMSEEEVLNSVGSMVQYAKDHGLKASFSTEDSTRTDFTFLSRLNIRAEQQGADRIGLTDTVGCISPEGMKHLAKKVKESINTPFSIHLHNDFNLALANALVGVQCGASAVATTVNGIGERGGNLALEEFVVAMKVLYNKDLGIDTSGLKELSELVSKLSGIKIPKNKPLVGSHAFSHESGIHVAATLTCPSTYEAIPPSVVGGRRRLVLGKHSGKTVVRDRLEEKRIEASEEEICDILREIKEIGEHKGRVSNREFWDVVNKHVKR